MVYDFGPPCPVCNHAGFSPGSELFDPSCLVEIPKLDAVEDLAWRIHRHCYAGENPYYFVECVTFLTGPYRGVNRFDADADTDVSVAVADALQKVEVLRT